MTLLISTIALVLAAMIAQMIQHKFCPNISVSYFDMLIGVILVFIPPLNHLIGQFDPELFMGLFVAPLLFFEGQSIRLNKVARNWHLIVSLTVIMVLFCAFAATFAARLFVSNLALAVILGALSTPTDATALESTTKGLILPSREGKALQL